MVSVSLNPVALLQKYTLPPDASGRSFINVQILDELMGTVTVAKTRKLAPIVTTIIEGTGFTCDDVLRTMYVRKTGKYKSIVAVAVSFFVIIILVLNYLINTIK